MFEVSPLEVINEASFSIRVRDPDLLDYERIRDVWDSRARCFRKERKIIPWKTSTFPKKFVSFCNVWVITISDDGEPCRTDLQQIFQEMEGIIFS